MERLIKYALEKGHRQYRCGFKEIYTVEDMLDSFGEREISVILLDAEEAEINLETLVQYANEVVMELKKEDEAREQRLKEGVEA